MVTLKNVSFEVVEAVKEDTKTVVPFLPQEEKEVTLEDAMWFIGRYNDTKEYFRITKEEVSEITETTSEEFAQEVTTTDKFICPVCGIEAASKAGLASHMRRHK